MISERCAVLHSLALLSGIGSFAKISDSGVMKVNVASLLSCRQAHMMTGWGIRTVVSASAVVLSWQGAAVSAQPHES
jgi:hypothetical protein